MKNKYEEALNYFLDREEGENVTITCDWLDYAEELKELVDKATPKKPTKLEKGKYSCDSCAMTFKLTTLVKDMFVNNQYCDVCGQKLDWSDEE